jgi:hypothetical protein
VPRSYRIHTMPTRRRAVGRVAAGESMTAVAADMGLPFSVVWSWCGQDGVRSAHPPITAPEVRARNRSRGATPAQRAEAVALFAAGAGYHRVAQRVGISHPVAYDLKRKWRATPFFDAIGQDQHGTGRDDTKVVDCGVDVGAINADDDSFAPVAPCHGQDRECPVAMGSTRSLGGAVVEVSHGTSVCDVPLVGSDARRLPVARRALPARGAADRPEDTQCVVADDTAGRVVPILGGPWEGGGRDVIRTRHDLTRAIRRAEDQGGRLAAGAALGGKTERQELGRLLLDLADVARRAYDPASARDWVDAMPQDGAA